jgi:hypothetical protein
MMRTRAVRGLLAMLPASVALLLAAAPLSTVLACSCSMASITDSLGFADVAFIGTSTAVEMPPPGEIVGSADPVHYSFTVESVFKGPADLGSEIVTTTALDGASCGTAFGMEERWLVFGNFGEEGITTGLCSGNVLLTDAAGEEAVLAELGAPIAEPRPGAAEPAAQAELPVAVLAGGVLVAALVGISLWAFVLEPRRRVR